MMNNNRTSYTWLHAEEIRERIKHAWLHADAAMNKVVGELEQQHVQETLSGQRKPSPKVVELVAQATGRTVDWLLNGDLEFTPCRCEEEAVQAEEGSIVDHFFAGPPGSDICSKAGCGESLAVHAEVPWQNLKHSFVPTGDGSCMVCTFDLDYELHQWDTCAECGHADKHNQPPIGLCSVKGCGCDGPLAELVPESEKVLHLCDQCHGEVYTFPKRVVQLMQRMNGPRDLSSTFVFTDEEGADLEISDGADRVPGVVLRTPANGVFVPLDTLEAVIDAIRTAGVRSLEDEVSGHG